VFSRQALNTTYFDAEKQVMWTVELIFMENKGKEEEKGGGGMEGWEQVA